MTWRKVDATTWEMVDAWDRVCGGVQRTASGWAAVVGYVGHRGQVGKLFRGGGEARAAWRAARRWVEHMAPALDKPAPPGGFEAVAVQQGADRDLFAPANDLFD